jgi:hypothetical protein
MLIAGIEAEAGRVLLIGLTPRNLALLQEGLPIEITEATHGAALPTGLALRIVVAADEQTILDKHTGPGWRLFPKLPPAGG